MAATRIAGLLWAIGAVIVGTVFGAQPPEPPKRPVLVVGASLDPSLLSSCGVTVDDLKTLAVAQLKGGGVTAELKAEGSPAPPRLSIFVPVIRAQADIAAFIAIEYQTPVVSPSASAQPLYAASWKRWWGGHADQQHMGPELRRGVKVLLDEFVAAYRKGL